MADRDETIEAQFARFQAVLGGIREIRARQDIPPRKEIQFAVRCNDATAELLRPMEPYFQSMAASRATAWGPDTKAAELSANVSQPGIEIFVDLADLIDVDAEIARNEKESTKIEALIGSKEKKLSNANFVDRAPADVVHRELDSLGELSEQDVAIQVTLEKLLCSSE